MSETWIIKDTAPVDEASRVLPQINVSFTSNGLICEAIEVAVEGNICELRYYDITYGQRYMVIVADIDLSAGETTFFWTDKAYRTLVFDTAPTGALLSWLQKNAISKTGINYQDIHLEDKELWNQLQTAWEQGDYTAALNVLKNASLADKQLNAAAINALTTELLRLQNQKDTGFKQDKIVVSADPPSDLANGKVYFRLIGPTTGYTVQNSYFIEILQKNGTSYDTLNPYVYATDVQLPVDFQSGGQFMSLDAIMADMAGFFFVS